MIILFIFPHILLIKIIIWFTFFYHLYHTLILLRDYVLLFTLLLHYLISFVISDNLFAYIFLLILKLRIIFFKLRIFVQLFIIKHAFFSTLCITFPFIIRVINIIHRLLTILWIYLTFFLLFYFIITFSPVYKCIILLVTLYIYTQLWILSYGGLQWQYGNLEDFAEILLKN
jgi:hypothetical protein